MKTLFLALGLAGVAACSTDNLGTSYERRIAYSCENGQSLVVDYAAGAARIENAGERPDILHERAVGSAYLYELPSRSIRGRGEAIVYSDSQTPPVRCRATTAP
jgi:hypothetical protein